MSCDFGAPVIIAKVTGTVSFASSLHVLWHLVIQGHVRRRQYYPYRPSAAAAAQQRRNSFSNSSRKSKRIATVNRIVCAVSIVDALSALSGHMLGTWLVPSSDSFTGSSSDSSGSTGCYTHGTVGSCRGQGAVFLTSVSLSVLWNASLVVTFVMLITWRYSEAQLARSEKWLLGVPIVIALLYGGLIPLLLDLYHPTSTRWYCFFMASLSSSSSSSQSTSTSTDSSTVTAGRAMASIGCLLHLLAITATLVGMATLYKSVREQEKKVEKFTMNSSERQQKFSSELSRRRSSLDEEALPSRNQSKLSPPALSLSLSQQSQPFQQQQQQQQQPPPQHRPQQRRTSFVLEEPKRRASLQGAHLSKKVQQQALRYVVAYSLVWIWFYLDVLLESIGVPPTTMGRKVVRVANAVCWPLQGFVNALSFSNFKYFEKSSKLLIDGLSKGRNSFVELSGRIVNALKKEMEKECMEDDDYDSDNDDDDEDDDDNDNDDDNSFTMTHDNHDQFNTSSLTNNGGTMTNNKIFYGDYTTNPQQPYLHSAPTVATTDNDEEDEENSPQPPPPPSNNNDTTHTTNNTYNINNNDNVNDIVTDMETTTTTLPMTASEDSEAMLSLT